MHLNKRLPVGAGLGGGSSDAAAALRALQRLWQCETDEADLQRIALSLGSDVPFFLGSCPAFATGRGEVLQRMCDYSLPYALLVVAAPVNVSTAWAFRRVTPKLARHGDLRAVVESNDLDCWRHALVNDFETPVFRYYPELLARKAELLDMGAGYASLTGTGAAVYGVFESWNRALQAAAASREAGCFVHLERAA